nr:SpaA isopeptide-forming pilin-related protein [uncultured Blautia sp.]
MKRRKWQKAAALIACVAMVGTETPNITNIVNGSSFEDGTEADFICDEKTESVDFISDLPSGDEVSQDENCGDVGFAGVAATEGENENPVAENPDTESPVEEKVVHTAPIARVLLDNVTGTADMKYQWIHVTSNVSQGEGNAKVCLTLTEPEGKAPVTKVKTALFAKQPEDFATAEITEWAQLNTPVILENACNGSENLNVNYVQDYEKNESGEYVTDENGNMTVTAAYLEYEVPAGSSTDFYAVFAYSQEEEAYTCEAELNAQATWEADGEETDILEKEEKNQIRFTLEKKAEDTEKDAEAGDAEKDAEVEGAEKDAEVEGAEKDAEAEGAEKDTEAEDTEKGAGDEAAKEENASGDGTIRDDAENVPEDSDKEALVQISLTKELEDESQPAEEAQNEENSDEQANENPDAVVEETAVFGQAYVVHVIAQDLHQDSGDDITVRLNMKDTDTGLPLQGISTSFGKTKEEALSCAGADTAQIPEGVNGQELSVSRVQESTEDDNGDAQLTSDYISFQLPAGETADFYVGITYTAQEEEYERNLAIEAQAQQLITEEGGETAEGDRQTAEENEGSCQASADTENINAANMLPSLPGALTTEVGEDIAEAGADEAVALNDVSEPEGQAPQPVEEGSQPEETPSESTEEKKLVNVLNGTAAVMLAWAARSGGGNRTLQAGDWLYFDVANSNNWEKDSAVISLSYGNGINASMTKCKQDHLYKIKLTQEMAESAWFKFTRANPNPTTSQDKIWNWMPQAEGKNLHFTENLNSNVFRASSFTDGAWDEGKWLTFNYAGEKLYFINLQQGAAQEAVTASFSVNGSSEKAETMIPDPSFPGLYSVTIPSGADYDTVTFKNGDNSYETTKILEADYNPDSTNTFYYGASEVGSGESKKTHSAWGTLPGNESIAGKKLYLDNNAFSTVSESASQVTIQIGTEAPVPLQVDKDSNMYLYTVPETSNATQQTLITLTAGDKIYRLFWSNIKKNKVTVTNNIAGVTGKYRNGYTVYYDATLSKLSYYNKSNDVRNEGKGIPYDDSSNVYYYAVDANGGKSKTGKMSQVDDSNGNLWSIDLSPEDGKEYTKIRFAGYENAADDSANGDGTDLLEIPWELDTPCYYGDDSDDVIYKGGNRGGYWDEKGSIRDAESGKNRTVVDVPNGTFTRSENTLYVDTTLYDYYSDYELNGNNRDNYDDVGIATHRIYQPFRQFNQALSQYYETNKVTYPLYWGNFQNYGGAHYSEIADTLKLYGYSNNTNQFFYENNSMWGIDGNEITQAGKNATQGLAGESLSGGNLTLSGGAVAPFFNESFLAGANSKNTVLGKVYHNVTIPFVKKALSSSADSSAGGTVDYWYFNSAESANEIANKNLQLQYDPVNGYFLQPTANPVKGQTIGSGGSYPPTADGNYFPFNTSNQSGKACRLNYGFGQKIEFKFRLTEDGTVTTTSNNKVPIEFNFSGDDDVWVYIDGQLVLDVGGGHGVVDGRINFKDKTAWVSKVKKSTEGGFRENVETPFPDSFIKDNDFNQKEHTLTMFYMERGLWESNMKITFNMPDNNQLVVEKEVDTSNVDSRFKGVFDDADFPINIKNLATSGASRAADTSGSKADRPITFTGTASPAQSDNIFETSTTHDAEYHWKALLNNTGQNYTDRRLGVITSKSTVDISNKKDYLEFQMYFDGGVVPQLSAAYIQIKDSSGNTLSGFLSGKVMTAPNLKLNSWNTVKVNLSKLTKSSADFDYGNIRSIAFQYDEARDIYLKNFTFSQENTSVGQLTGFTVKQEDIPDYDSISKETLKNAWGARYTKYTADSSGQINGMVDSNGMFTLRDGQKATFNDQFRRGSYVYLEEYVDPDLFDTFWTLYENGKEVTSMTNGEKVINPTSSQVVKQSGTVVDDGRTEKSFNSSKPGKALLFRSYAYPNSETTLIKLKAKYVNKVKVGGLTIKKTQGNGSNTLNDSYEFTIKFEDIAGLGKTIPDITFKLKAGESKMFTGIPAGTRYTITETAPTDGSTLESIVTSGNDETSFSVSNRTVTGVITADTEKADYTVADFVNTKIPKTAIHVEKIWKNADNCTLPSPIKVKLQRRVSDDAEWQDIEGIEAKELNAQKDWKCDFSGLNRYSGSSTDSVEYQYRVVELDTNGNILEEGGTFNRFQVSYNSTSNTDKYNNKSVEWMITNTYSPLTAIKVIKIDAATKVKLPDVEFKLEKINTKGSSPQNDEVDSSFVAVTHQTNSDGECIGECIFEKLENGLYRLTETKAAANHSLLKAPVYITIDRASGCLIDGAAYEVKDDTITLTIANSPKFELPATGSWSRMILSFCGAILMGMSVIMYLLQKRRKEGKTS